MKSNELEYTVQEIIQDLKNRSDPSYVKGMMRFGIDGSSALGIRIPQLRKLAKQLGKDHDLALSLWETAIHEARLLAIFIDEPAKVTEAQLELWVSDLRSWDICDQACSLFDRTSFAHDKAKEWSIREPEFEKRAGFALMATMAVHCKILSDDVFLEFLPIIEREAHDERNFVKKAVNWALRQIGKRSIFLLPKAIATTEAIHAQGSKSARWIANDALRELTKESMEERLRKKSE